MNLERLYEMENKHREEILTLLSSEDELFLKNICEKYFDRERNVWKVFTKNDCKLGPFYDHEGILYNLIRAGIIIHEYGYAYGISWFSVNSEYRTFLKNKYDL